MIENNEKYQLVSSLLEKLKTNKEISLDEYKELLENNYELLSFYSNEQQFYNLGLSVVCHVSEYLPADNLLISLLEDNIEASRVFLYDDMLERTKNIQIKRNIFSSFIKHTYTLDTDTVLTKDQKKLFEEFQKHRKIIVSAPTSFGKSRIVEEIIIHNNYKSIVIVLPTIALLSETFIKFNLNPKISEKYNIVNSLTSAENLNASENTILIFTPEKMDLFLDENPSYKIDFFVMDEIYKIDEGDERSKIFTNCLYRLSKQGSDFYLIGPYFEKFSQRFIEKTNSNFLKFTAEIVQKDIYDFSKINYNDEILISNKKIKRLKSKERILLNVLKHIDGQSLVYIGRKDSVESKARKIAEQRERKFENELINYIKENIAEDWSLVNCLEKGVAFHHGAVPKYIQTEIIDAFNKNENNIEILVSTTTLTEGVNTSAKNVIIFDNTKGDLDLTGFDVKNIKGRAGRFLVHFVGRVIYLDSIHEENKEIIEFSYYDNNELTEEELIQVKMEDLDKDNLIRRERIELLLKKHKVPFTLIKRNKFIPIQKQISLIDFLRNNTPLLDDLFFTENLPQKEVLRKILYICYNYLFNEKDKNNKNYTIDNLIRLTNYYVYKRPSIKELIKEQRGKKTDTRIRQAFNLITHYFEFALPKYLTAFENIFNFVYSEFKNPSSEEKINLKYLITFLEYGFVNPHEIALKEVGLPNDIIKKVSDKFSDCNTIQDIKLKFKYNNSLINNLSDFEKRIFRKYV